MPAVGSVAMTAMLPLCDLPVLKQRLCFLSASILSKVCLGSKPPSKALPAAYLSRKQHVSFRKYSR
jgi:hypothetical protein